MGISDCGSRFDITSLLGLYLWLSFGYFLAAGGAARALPRLLDQQIVANPVPRSRFLQRCAQVARLVFNRSDQTVDAILYLLIFDLQVLRLDQLADHQRPPQPLLGPRLEGLVQLFVGLAFRLHVGFQGELLPAQVALQILDQLVDLLIQQDRRVRDLGLVGQRLDGLVGVLLLGLLLGLLL